MGFGVVYAIGSLCVSLTTFAGLKAAKHPSASPCFLSNKARALATRSSSLSEDSIHVCPPRSATQSSNAPSPLASSHPPGVVDSAPRHADSSSSGGTQTAATAAAPAPAAATRVTILKEADINGCVSSSNLLHSLGTADFFAQKNKNKNQNGAVFVSFLVLCCCCQRTQVRCRQNS